MTVCPATVSVSQEGGPATTRSENGSATSATATSTTSAIQIDVWTRKTASSATVRAASVHANAADKPRKDVVAAGNLLDALAGGLTGTLSMVGRLQPALSLEMAYPIKDGAAEAIRQLHAEGIQVVMLTGDSRTTAANVARRLSIDRFEAEVLPDEKLAVIKRLQSEGRVVAMAGDGINDAPALAAAAVGIAMGTGADVAMESAGVTLVKGDLRGIVRARILSRATMGNIKQNLFFAFVYNALGVPIAAGVLYPFFGLLLSPVIAAAAMSFSSVSVITNALRLRRVSL